VDRLLVAGQTTVDTRQRLATYRTAQRLIWTDAPWVFLWSQKFYVVTSSHLRDVGITPTEKWSALYATWQ
jgi:peptide/nickel transport system substrate-binding protein